MSRAGRSHASPDPSARPHSVPRRPIREPTTLESLARWSAAIAPGQRALSKQARRLSEGFGLGRGRLPQPAEGEEPDDEAWEAGEAGEDWTEAAAIDIHASDGEIVRSARWYEVGLRRLLLLIYASGVQVWMAKDNLEDDIDEVLNLRESEQVNCARLIACPASLGSPQEPVLVIATSPSPSATVSTLKLYSLTKQTTLQVIAIPARAHSLEVNDRVIAVGCLSPPSLHLYSTETFQPLESSPLLDVPSPPVYTLSSSRLVAYATVAPLSSDISNILAGRGRWHDGDDVSSPNPTAGRRSSSQGEAARRIVSNGVKAIGDIGLSYWNSRTQAPSYSRSAPGSSPSESRASVSPRHAGFVRVLDLATLQPTAHFRPTESSVALLSFDPAGGMLLTGSSEARSFHVFELRGGKETRVWHRYDLSRGMTSARAEIASWSRDGRFVAISTSRGTAHVYPILPQGGSPRLDLQFAMRPQNIDEVPPLSVVLSAIARIRPPRSTSAKLDATPLPPVAPAITFLPAATSTRQLALYYPHLGGLVLDKLSLRVRSTEPSSPSGLSQLMRAKDAIRPTSSVTLQHIAAWPLQRSAAWAEVKVRLPSVKAARSVPANGRHSAQAELHTFSSSPRVLPLSVYLSHQFDFLSLAKGQTTAYTRGNFSLAQAKRVPVRHEVEMVTQSGEPDDAQLRQLMQSALGLTGSPSAELPPAFPMGVPAARGPSMWQRAIPILANGHARASNSSHSTSTTPCSVSFEDEDAVRDVDSSTPVTASVSDPSTSPPDHGWGFEDETLTPSPIKPAGIATQQLKVASPSPPPTVAIVPAGSDAYEDFGAGLLDEQHTERAVIEASQVQLQAPIEPTRATAGGKAKRKNGRKSGGSSPGRSV